MPQEFLQSLKYAAIRELKRLRAAFSYSVDGLKASWREDAPFRLEVVLGVILIVIAVIFGGTSFKKALLIGSVLLVVLAELLNIAVESVVNMITQEYHPLAKKAKDVGSAAVLVALANVVVVWAFLLI